MFFNKLHSGFKRIVKATCATTLLLSLSTSMLAPISVYADEATSAPASVKTSTFKFANIDLQVDVPDDLVGFTQNVTSNNAYLEKIGAEDAEGLRNTMIAGNIYLEAIPKDVETVTYEIIIKGEKLASTEVTDLNTLSEDELNKLFKDYTSGINKKNEQVEETLKDSSIEKIGDATYFCTDVTTVSATDVTVQLKKYYTIKNGYYYTFSVQTTEKTISSDMEKKLTDMIASAQYKEIKAGLFDNPIFSEIFSIVVTSVAPIAILGVIFFISIKMTTKKKRPNA